MLSDSLYQIKFAEINSFSTTRDEYLHCKVTPFYIFAQAYEGHYELDADGEHAICEEGGAFFTAPGQRLRIRHFVNPKTGVMRVRFFHFFVETQFSTDAFADRKPCLKISAKESKRPAQILQNLLRDAEGNPANVFKVNIDLFRILELLWPLTAKREKLAVTKDVRIFFQTVQENIFQPVCIESFLRNLSCSRSKFFSDFHSATGLSPAQYVLRKRIHNALAEMLMNREISIKELSDRCGWKTPYHFSRCFKSVMGASPRNYIKKAENVLSPNTKISD